MIMHTVFIRTQTATHLQRCLHRGQLRILHNEAVQLYNGQEFVTLLGTAPVQTAAHLVAMQFASPRLMHATSYKHHSRAAGLDHPQLTTALGRGGGM